MDYLTDLIPGRFKMEPTTGTRLKKLTATGKNPLQTKICIHVLPQVKNTSTFFHNQWKKRSFKIHEQLCNYCMQNTDIVFLWHILFVKKCQKFLYCYFIKNSTLLLKG